MYRDIYSVVKRTDVVDDICSIGLNNKNTKIIKGNIINTSIIN